MAHHLAKALHASRAYDDDEGKSLLWCSLCALVTQAHLVFRQVATRQRYRADNVSLYACASGIVVYTVQCGQINVNVAVQRRRDASTLVKLTEASLLFFDQLYEAYAIDWEPLRTHAVPFSTHTTDDSLPANRQRRFVPAKSYIQRLVLVLPRNEVMLMGLRQPIAFLLHDATDIRLCDKPLAAMRAEDPESTVYWYRAACGTLVALRNPTLALDAIECFPEASLENIADIGFEDIRRVVVALQPDTVDQNIDVMRASWLPTGLRCFHVELAVRLFGLSDDFVMRVADIFKRVPNVSLFVYDVQSLGSVLSTRRGFDVDRFVTTFEKLRHQVAWRIWAATSPFVYATIATMSVSSLKHLCDRLPYFRDIAAKQLAGRVGTWTAADESKAEALLALGEGVGLVRDEVTRLRESRKKRRRRRTRAATVVDAVEEVEACDEVLKEEETTHHALVARFAHHYALTCDLIGSGLFRKSHDADVVVTVDDTDLATAYAHVSTALCVPVEREVGEAVVALHTTFEGVKMDVQVTRLNAADTPAEEATRRALHLSRRLCTDTDARVRSWVCALHDWTEAAGVKGHTMCRLPGVAVTCVAVVLASSGMDNPWSRVRAALACTSPRVDLDAQSVAEERGSARPATALMVLAEGALLTTRMTVSTTRHLLDCVCAHLDGVRDYGAWRRAHMWPCVRVRPRAAATVAHTLHAVAARLDGHPLMDALHFEEEEEAIVVYATLCASADVRTYGFRDGDVVTVGDDGVATVTRGARTWPLCARRGHATASMPPVVSDTRYAGRDGWVVPNAPYLTVDVRACFDPRAWEVV